MPDFAASLISAGSVTIAVDSDCTTITVTDSSNYAASDESGHLQAAFATWRKIIILQPDQTDYTFSSLGDGDASTGTGDTNPTTAYTISDGDGIYKVTLRTLPDYGGGFTYEIGDCVYNATDELLYISLVNANSGNAPELSASDWETIEEDSLPAKYNVVNGISISCALNTCIEDAVLSAYCSRNDRCPDAELSTSEVKAIQIIIAGEVLDNYVNTSDFDNASLVSDYIKSRCNC